MKYDKFKFLFPPRPHYKIPPHDLQTYETGEYVSHVKYNGSCCVVFTNGQELHVMNRHNSPLTNWNTDIEFKKLAKSENWYVYAGEYLNKGKLGENGTKEKDKFVIWDVLVWDGEYLTGMLLLDRLKLLERIYPCNRAVVKGGNVEMYEHLCCTEYNGIYKAPTYMNNFKNLYNEVIQTPLYEGIVLKKIESRLTFGFQELNNQDWQLKCRAATSVYDF